MGNDKSLFFMTLSLLGIWIILDIIYGKKYLWAFLHNLFPFVEYDGSTASDSSGSDEEKEGVEKFADDDVQFVNNKKTTVNVVEA